MGTTFLHYTSPLVPSAFRSAFFKCILDRKNKYKNIVARRYGSPHHSRSQSVRTAGSKSTVQLQLGPNGVAKNRCNQLSLPQQRSRVASMPNTGVEEEYYRIRQFSITGKGVINRGDSLKSRRSKSNNSVASSNSRYISATVPGHHPRTYF